MKKVLFLFFSILIVFSCNVSEKLLKQGDYHGAVINAVNKLKRNPHKAKQIEVLEKAYPLAVKKDMEKIKELNEEGQPDRWEQIYKIYKRLKERQELVESITPLNYNGKIIKFEHKDYTTPMIAAKRNAARYYYAHAKKLMQENRKRAYREAFFEFQKAKKYDHSLYDIDTLMDICYQKGQTYVIITIKNQTIYKLSNDFYSNLLNFPIAQLNSLWIKYFTTDIREGKYDITIFIVLRIIDVSPDRIEEKHDVYKKKVQDGYEYKLDSKGNIVRDSSGNPIKVPKYKMLTCTLNTFRQYKIAHIEGQLEYRDNYTSQLLLQVPIAADHVYEHYYYTANGEISILPDKIKRKLNSRPEPFPHPLDMIYAANETLKNVIFKALIDHKIFLEQNY